MTVANSYHFKQMPAERTPIQYVQGTKPVRCSSCGRTAKPLIIVARFLSRPLRVCGSCRSVIQECEGEK